MELMPIGSSWIMPANQALWFTHQYIRNRISMLNHIHSLNIKVHSVSGQSLEFWHDPTPGKQSPLLQLEEAKQNFLKAVKTQNVEQMLFSEKEIERLQNEITNKGKAFTRINKGAAIGQPIEAVLAFWKLTRNEFDLKRPEEQMKLWIQAEVAIKKEQTND